MARRHRTLQAFVGLAALAGPLLAGRAAAAGRWSNPSGPVFDRGASGVVSASDRGHALRKLRFYGPGGGPLRLRAVEAPFDGEGVRYAVGDVQVRFAWRGERTADVGEGHYLTALQVCSAADGGLGALRVWGAPLRDDGTLAPPGPAVSLPEAGSGPGCARWHPPATCGRGGVAWAVRAWYDRHRGITALALRCRPPPSTR